MRKFGIAFDTSDTGTGKTYVACKAAEALGCARAVVVCPNIVERKWRGILDEATVGSTLVFPYSLLNRTASTNGYFEFRAAACSEVVINGNGKLYEREVPKHYECTLKPGTDLALMVGLEHTLLILDETHKAKNASTQLSQAIHKLIKHVRDRSGWVLHISATPFDQLFQLPQYLRFIGVGCAAELLAKAGGGEPGAGRCEFHWDVNSILQSIFPKVGKEKDVKERLVSLKGCGGEMGPRWKAVFEFLCRASEMCSLPDDGDLVFNILCNLQSPGSTVLAPGGGCAVMGHLKTLLRSWGTSRQNSFTPGAILDTILLPVSIMDLGGDVASVRRIVTDVMPRMMSRMVLPDLGFDGHSFDLFLDDVNVMQTVIELTFLPKYLELTGDSTGTLPMAPLSSPSGLAYVPEDAVSSFMNPLTYELNPEWRLGEELPVRVWRDVMLSSRGTATKLEAQAMYEMCRTVRLRLLEEVQEVARGGAAAAAESEAAGAEGGGGLPFHSMALAKWIKHGFVRLETLKTASLFRLVSDILSSDERAKVVVMFNYKNAVDEFERMLGSCRPPVSFVKVTGDIRPGLRADLIDRWNHDPVVKILLCTIHVMNEGIDLHDTGGDAHRYNFIMACPSAEKTIQAKGRIVRTGMKSHAINCVVYGGHALGGELEERLIMRLDTKRAVLNAGGNPTPVHSSISLKSSRDFVDVAKGIHGGAGLAQQGSVAVSREGGREQNRESVKLFDERWKRLEFGFRMWSTLKKLIEWHRNPDVSLRPLWDGGDFALQTGEFRKLVFGNDDTLVSLVSQHIVKRTDLRAVEDAAFGDWTVFDAWFPYITRGYTCTDPLRCFEVNQDLTRVELTGDCKHAFHNWATRYCLRIMGWQAL